MFSYSKTMVFVGFWGCGAPPPREEPGQGFLIRKQRVLKVSWAAAGAPGKEPGRPKKHVYLLENNGF